MQLEMAQSAKRSIPPREELEKAVEIAREIRTRERFNKLDFYDPYPYQKKELLMYLRYQKYWTNANSAMFAEGR